MKYLFDTNVVIAFLKAEPEIIRKMTGLAEFNISVITKGEMQYGARNSANPERNMVIYSDFFRYCNILEISGKTADNYAEIRLKLKSAGRPIPENDIWIAASAREHNLKIITRDKHLLDIDFINSELW